MDEPGWSWPAWKFGMKREDLTTKLHDQYNTFPSAIQDPEAFHHDVSEISHEASTPDEFHRLMVARKKQRLQELHDSLESAAFEIIAHPKLIGTEQWQYALQLFRTRSLDSLVRYFSSYLSHRYRTPSSVASSFTECSINTASTNPSSVDGDNDDGAVPVPTFLAGEDKPSFTHEPEDFHESLPISLDTKIPHSDRSMTMKSDAAASSPTDDVSCRDYALHPPTPPRTLSFSGSESGSISAVSKSLNDDDETSQSSEGESPAASEPDLSESRSSLESISFSGSKSGRRQAKDYYDEEEAEEDIPSAQLPVDSLFDDDFETVQVPLEPWESMESETPTPRQETMASSYIDSEARRPFRVRSPHRASSPKSPRLKRHEGTPPQCIRRSPEELFSRIQKPLPDPIRTRRVGRRRLD